VAESRYRRFCYSIGGLNLLRPRRNYVIFFLRACNNLRRTSLYTLNEIPYLVAVGFTEIPSSRYRRVKRLNKNASLRVYVIHYFRRKTFRPKLAFLILSSTRINKTLRSRIVTVLVVRVTNERHIETNPHITFVLHFCWRLLNLTSDKDFRTLL